MAISVDYGAYLIRLLRAISTLLAFSCKLEKQYFNDVYLKVVLRHFPQSDVR